MTVSRTVGEASIKSTRWGEKWMIVNHKQLPNMQESMTMMEFRKIDPEPHA